MDEERKERKGENGERERDQDDDDVGNGRKLSRMGKRGRDDDFLFSE